MNFPPKMPKMPAIGDLNNMLGSVMPHLDTPAEMHGKASKAVQGGQNMVQAQLDVLKEKAGNNGDLAHAFQMGEHATKAGKGAIGQAGQMIQGGAHELSHTVQQGMANRAGMGNVSESFGKVAHQAQGNPAGNVAEAAQKGAETASKAKHKAEAVGNQVASAGGKALNKLKHLF